MLIDQLIGKSSAQTVHTEVQYEDIFTLVRRNPTSGLVSVSLFILTNVAVNIFIEITFYSLRSFIKINYINNGMIIVCTSIRL